MRHALGFLTALALAGCGGGKPKPPPLGNEAAPPPAASWTIDRAFATLDPDAALVFYVDVDALKANEMFSGLTEQIEKAFAGQVSGPCDSFSMDGKLLGTASMDTSFDFTIWAIGGSTDPWLDCLRANAEAKGMKVTADGDYLTTSTDKAAISYLLLDRETLLFAASTQTITREEMLERTQPNAGAGGIPQVQKLRGSGAPIWMTAQGSSKLFSVLPMKFRTGVMTIDVEEHIDIDVNVGFSASNEATLLASTIQQQGQALLSMGFVSALDAHSMGEDLIVHAELTKASIDKIIAMASAVAGRGGGKPFAPTP